MAEEEKDIWTKHNVLAKVFVPYQLREINFCPVDLHLQAHRPFQNSHYLNNMPTLVPLHVCTCGSSHQVAIPPTLPIDIYYALCNNNNNNNNGSNGIHSSTKTSDQLPSTNHIINSLETYYLIWRGLLMAERKAKLILYENFSQYSAPVHFVNKTAPDKTYIIGSLYIHGIADTVLEINDTVLLRPMYPISWVMPNSTIHQAVFSPPTNICQIQTAIQAKERRKVDRLAFDWLTPSQANLLAQMMGRQKKSDRFNVRFVPSITNLERCLTALEWLRQTNISMSVLSPTVAPTVKTLIQVDDPTLNQEQNAFLNMVMDRTDDPSYDEIRGPMILTGPAGVGKTKTLLAAVHSVLEAHPHHRILICTPSHTAADVVTMRLGTTVGRSLFRLFDSDRPIETVPTQVLMFCEQDNSTGTFVLPSKILQYRVIVCTCVDAHLLYRIGLTNQQLRSRRNCLQHYMTTTFPDTNLSFTLDGVDEPHFTHLFVDEAAQATEPETMIPLSVVGDFPIPGIRKVEIALVGDPRQLSPQVHSNEAAYAGLSLSWMERLLLSPVKCLGGGEQHMMGQEMLDMADWLKYSFRNDGRERLSVFLTLNYRGHPSFLMMPSVLFYSDKLRSVEHNKAHSLGENFWCEKLRHVEALSTPVVLRDENEPEEVCCRKQFSWPIHFRAVKGSNVSVSVKSGFASGAWTNPPEAEVVAEIVSELVSKGVQTQSIGVMAPFRGQVVLIRTKLRELKLGAVNVGTVEDYQAVERDVIVLSLTRSGRSFFKNDIAHRMGVFGQPKRSNVAMTRAEFLFIVVGDPKAMASDHVWHQFMMFCHRNGLYYGHPPISESVLRWSESNRVVRKKPDDPKVSAVMVSSLERLLRNPG